MHAIDSRNFWPMTFASGKKDGPAISLRRHRPCFHERFFKSLSEWRQEISRKQLVVRSTCLKLSESANFKGIPNCLSRGFVPAIRKQENCWTSCGTPRVVCTVYASLYHGIAHESLIFSSIRIHTNPQASVHAKKIELTSWIFKVIWSRESFS